MLISCTRLPVNRAPPSVDCVPDHLDLGDIIQHEERSCTFALHNDTGEAIEIIRLNTSCGCTSVKAESTTVQRGAVDHVTATLAPDLRLGGFESIVTIIWRNVSSDQPNKIRVTLTADAVRLIKTDPPICHFGNVDADHTSLLNFDICRGEAKTPWNNLKLSSTKFDISWTKVDNNKFRVSLPLSADKLPLGVIQDDITASLLEGDKIAAQMTIPVELNLVSDIIVTPPTLYNGVMNQYVSKRGVFSIESTASAGLQFISVDSSDSDFIQARCIKTQPGKLVFEYATNANSSPGAHSGHFLVSVKTDKSRRVQVPFISYIQ